MSTKTDFELMIDAKYDIERCLGNFSALKVQFRDTDPMGENTLAGVCAVFNDGYSFEMHVEIREQKSGGRAPFIHSYEDVWDELCDEAIWRKLFWEALDEVKER